MSALGDLTEIANGKFHGRSQLQAMASAILTLQHETNVRVGVLEKKKKAPPPVVEKAKPAVDREPSLKKKYGRSPQPM